MAMEEGLESAHDVSLGTKGADIFPMRDGLVEEPEPAHELMIGITDEAAPAVSHEGNPHIVEGEARRSSTPHSSYVPQFSATQSLILSRIKQNALLKSNSPTRTPPNLASHTKGDTKEHLQQHTHDQDPPPPTSTSTQGRLGETLAMPSPPSGDPAPSAAARIVDAANSLHRLGLKRKRDQADVDFATQSTISFPFSAVKPAAPTRREEFAGRGDSGIKDKETSQAVVNGELEKLRSRNLAALPEGVFPAKTELVGFPAGQASDQALTEYFYGKKRTDLLNILSFADQLRPQLLVDVLVSVSKRHPDLPLFDTPRWNAEPPSSSAVHLKLTHKDRRHPHPHAKPRHGHVILPSDAKARGTKHHKSSAASRKTLKNPDDTTSTLPPLHDMVEDQDRNDNDADNGDDGDAGENRDSLPPTWPKAGEGLYAKLTAEDQDRALLVDENDEEAFSHFAVDRYGKQMALLLPAACG